MMDIISTTERRSLRCKRTLLFVNIVSFWFAGYFFLRHNSYCEPGGKLAIFQFFLAQMYSIFCVIFFSLYIVCLNGVHSSSNEYGISYDRVLGFQR